MTGVPAVLVTKKSATHGRPWEYGPEYMCAINRTHSNLVKFGEHDHEYEAVLVRLKALSGRAIQRGKLPKNFLSDASMVNMETGQMTAKQEHVNISKNVHWKVPYSVNPHFVGRQSLLKRVELTLVQPPDENTSEQMQRRLVISGMGGQGKSEICLKIANLVRQEYVLFAIL